MHEGSACLETNVTGQQHVFLGPCTSALLSLRSAEWLHSNHYCGFADMRTPGVFYGFFASTRGRRPSQQNPLWQLRLDDFGNKKSTSWHCHHSRRGCQISRGKWAKAADHSNPLDQPLFQPVSAPADGLELPHILGSKAPLRLVPASQVPQLPTGLHRISQHCVSRRPLLPLQLMITSGTRFRFGLKAPDQFWFSRLFLS